MKLTVHIKTKAYREVVEKIGEHTYNVSVREAPEKGKANTAVRKTLARYLKVPQSTVSISAGHASRVKIISLDI